MPEPPVQRGATPAPKFVLPPAPLVPRCVATDIHFGEIVTDPYRYLEDTASPEVMSYLNDQADYARRTLDAIPGRTALLERITKLAEDNVAISNVQIVSDRIFYYKISPGETSHKLYKRESFQGQEKLLYDPQVLSRPGERYSIDFFIPSPNGNHIVVGIAANGSENTSLRVLETTTGRDTGIAIDRIGFANTTTWAPDSKSFFYNRLPKSKPGETNRYLRSRIHRHVLGRPQEKDEALLGGGAGKINLADIDIPQISLSKNFRYALGTVRHGDRNEISLYLASYRAPEKINWKKIVGAEDEVTDFILNGEELYLLSHKNAPRYKVLRMTLARPNIAKAITVVPQGAGVIKRFAIAQDALYLHELAGGADRLQRLNFSGTRTANNKLEWVRLPFDLAIRQMITDPLKPGAVLRLEGWTEPPQYVTVEARSGNWANTGLHPPSKADFSAIDEVHLTITARDGTRVPLTLMYKKGTTLNANNPALIRAYGAYGMAQLPTFSPAVLAWLERGGILGTCHVRGGGEWGQAWHQAGQKLDKPNTWRDLIDCAEYLVTQKFTRKEKLAIHGRSAGGIAVGRAMTERPDLFAAVISGVGLLDTLRAEFAPNGPPNIPEFGSVANADGFKGLLAMSSYHQIKDGTKYPAVLLTHGINDPRVAVWHSAKMAARLQTATASTKPVLLKIDYDAGHGIGSTTTQRNAEQADIYSFLLWQFGDAAFQPG